MTAGSGVAAGGTPATRPLVTREDVAGVLVHAGFAVADIAHLTDGLRFPATLDEVIERAQRQGITRGTLVERLGGSP